MEILCRTNEVIERASHINDLTVEGISGINGLEYVIETMVDNNNYYVEFGKINFMIALPDNIEMVAYIREPLFFDTEIEKAENLQYIMQMEIINTLKLLNISIPLPEGDEDRVFIYVPTHLSTLAEPRRRLVKPALKNIIKRTLITMFNQFNMKQPEIRDTSNLGRLNLTTLIKETRVSGTSLKNKMRRALGTSNPEVDDEPNESLLFRLCRSLGLYMSTQNPTSYINHLRIDSTICIMYDGITQQRYKQFKGIWWQIDKDNRRIQLLEELII
ncbi:uncharacterized protein LOC126837664 isoform X2 [Adelges cooleyi]|uniref:uncharacterized protein LOC126837664 isoform X2 n=1 Tax=Adelges cooleyi TaxID=133065 RepID=UPI0021808746|nr:uncharacterized protein LOC126837664 isoform X2 [Adelges cooleyi]